MSNPGDTAALAEAQRLRSEAWARVNGDVAALRGGLTERPITQRLKDHAADRAVGAVDTAKAVAKDNPLVIAAAAAALIAWSLRGPLGRFAQKRLGRWFGA
jgi:hypothetical protein